MNCLDLLLGSIALLGVVWMSSVILAARQQGLRSRARFMHDGTCRTKQEAINRHRGEASFVTDNYRKLSRGERRQLLIFLDSL